MKCPVRGCTRQAGRDTPLCDRHWQAVPPSGRQAIARTQGQGVDSPAYRDARLKAIVYAEEWEKGVEARRANRTR